ncbi:DUF1430 domain-containing protein [Clostridium botulinum]|uniref:bacteriocin-associated integral membrane family protein n=1 Tax=Clostridium botulinum TaxID=1491 RepID=UPI00046E6D34|nr:DUF1430 domain-containing protein [Clostridium botulinum]KEI79916.1 membrane protein [Clostridium botulinum B2 331]NFA90784.1 DUF1430 domain-containing protein [Clostridium botulinum]NFB20732.1 DUF1430 domain-containing protein [Clostridium botulinum]NFB57372.1 DUF1430 domain-containing protein [Clostridium botulinum]NFB61127.1 DUF1430 domain-containing protein [Clostridium botulinum]
MKKFISILLLTISMFSFFILYNQHKQSQIYNIKNVEHNLKNSYEVIIPSTINKIPISKQQKLLLDASHGEDINFYYTRVITKNSKEKIIKYIYTTNNNYMDKIQLEWGKKLDSTLMYSNYFLSTEDTGDKNQIGKIASFDGISMEIRTLNNLIDDGLLLDGPCIVTVPSGKNFNNFINILKNALDAKFINSSKSQNIGQVPKNNYLQISVLFFIVMLLILYDILKSYKKIAIEKLLGYSNFDIWKKRIFKILIIQLIAIVISIIIMSLFLFKKFNIYHIYFLKDLTIKYIILTIITFIIASLPFIYVNNIHITSAIKNKYPAKEILLFNIVIKILLCIGFIFIINKQATNYKDIKKVFDGSYKRWENVSNYRILNFDNVNFDSSIFDISSSSKNIKIYEYFNKKGAIFAAFHMYTDLSLSLNSYLHITSMNALVNPNYLKENPVYDTKGKKISISEQNNNWILLVPIKYKKYEGSITKFHKRWIHSSGANGRLEIIWTKSGQKLFSYNFVVNPDQGNYVTDPILLVGTENGAYPGWNAQLFNIDGNPFKVKVDSSKADKSFIESELNKYGYPIQTLKINYANEELNSKIKDFKDLLLWSITGIILLLVSVSIIIIQSIYNFFEQFKITLAIRQLHGYKKISNYKEYFYLILTSWIIVIICAFISKIATAKIILIVSTLGLITEFIVSLLMLSYIQKKKIIEFIKGGA